MKRIALYASLLFTSLLCCGCDSGVGTGAPTQKPGNNNGEEPPVEETLDWQKIADLSSGTMLDYYWNKDRNFFNYYPSKADTPAEDWHYWPQAHAMDVIIDAYVRTGDAKWKGYFSLWHEGVKQKSGGSYFNDFVDDMEWICLTMLRLYECTKEQKYMDTAELLWNKIKENWNTQGGGGIAWKQSQQWSKNACSNGPAGIIATRMYELNGQKKEDLQWAEKIYEWQSSKLVDIQTGAVWDNLDARSGAVQKDWIFTYNQGTYLGMAHGLYRITGGSRSDYLEMAVKAAEYAMNKLTVNGILKSEGMGDGGLFKGIFIRYFAKLIQEEDLRADKREKFQEFLDKNAETLYYSGTNKSNNLYSDDWTKPGDWDNDMPCQVSACMLIEAKALYEKNK